MPKLDLIQESLEIDNKQLAKYIVGLQSIAAEYEFDTAFYGHAGDGELHVRPYLDLSDPADVQKMPVIANEVFSLAWSLGGSISGEHADGRLRTQYVVRQYPNLYHAMREIKALFDPENIMNPRGCCSS